MKLSSCSEGTIEAEAVRRYFNQPSHGNAGAVSMMAHEHNLPADAAVYRLRQEVQTISDWLDAVPVTGRVLDLGCGAGGWLAVFANRYASVIGMEQSSMMVEAARERMHMSTNIEFIEGDVRAELPDGPFDLIFLGGLCMYLNDGDTTTLLRTLPSRLTSGGSIILRESTVREGRSIAEGEYQAVYRSPSVYRTLFIEAGFRTSEVRRNYGYNAMVTGEALVNLRRRWIPFLPTESPFLGALTWWGLRSTALVSFWLLPRVFSLLGITWPQLRNHFFRLRSGSR
ncbi:MAG TPA: class I SAM-dependent methyltransferase [Nitrospirales bacterium]|nr:class I SAM-dependent methyltransferase [Nitrospirales bacterium]